jgi:hypothetical protein
MSIQRERQRRSGEWNDNERQDSGAENIANQAGLGGARPKGDERQGRRKPDCGSGANYRPRHQSAAASSEENRGREN